MPKGQPLQSWEVNRLADLVAIGRTNKQIAEDMRLNPATVQRWRKAHPMMNGHVQTAEEAVIAVYVESTDYPQIKMLLTKQQQYRNMAEQAERMGDDELSLMLMSRMELTPLEQEILRYWAETHSKE